jgi:hypothetical protein
MKKFAVYTFAVMLALPISVASAAQSFNQRGGLKPYSVPPTQTPTPVGFASVLCVVNGISGESLGNGTGFTFNGFDFTGSNLSLALAPATSTITVTITNDTTLTSSQYTVTFVDVNGDSVLDCGDTIVSIVPAS